MEYKLSSKINENLRFYKTGFFKSRAFFVRQVQTSFEELEKSLADQIFFRKI